MSLRDGATTRADGAPAGPADGALVRCVNVARTFGTGPTAVVAVHDVSCTVPSGARVALMGPSGSGKSTLLHLIAGLEAPTGGTIAWPGLGAGPNGRPGPIGVIFQGPSLIPTLDVTENVALPLLFAGVPAEAATVSATAALDRVGIADLGPKLPEELSGGQAQRAAAARVIAGRPRLILADEPTGQLDHETGGHVISVLLEAAEELEAALIVATHDAQIAARLPHRWTMRDGGLTTRGAGPGDDRRP
ncbi:ATP-binding cassette domain-containing protein [Actinoallomurus purpureus]|uniref:ABC transporter ATP-binding protein n=1 Tax=Actinoallomurus purpureus TaxID=478114 RepID=UPI0020939046|nr:ATP-binding cassette domain-containing protein [Actinoallomurus purpureus]MCO6003822.1 ATP-binding cassette domain-containing protein [Actinoallomurus purpureus]